MIRSLTPVLVLALAFACSEASDEAVKPAPAAEAAELNLAAVQWKDNKTLLFAGSGEHKEFMAEVVPVVGSWFNEQDVGFESTHYADLTVAEIKQRIAAAASALSDEGSLALYFLTHGSPDGYMLARDRLFRMSEIVETLKASRSKPIRRLLIFVETCYSGNQINTFGLTDETGSDRALPLEMADDDPMLGGLVESGFGLTADNFFTEAVVVTSSKNNQLSNVPAFSNALFKGLLDFNYEDDATIRQWLEKVKQHTLADAPAAQEPMYKGIPDSVLDKKLWMDERAPAPGTDQIAPELLKNTITPDGITDEQVEEAKDSEKKEGEGESGKTKKPKVSKEEDAAESDEEDDGDDGKSKKKKKEPKSKGSGGGKSGGNGAGCGIVGQEVEVSSLALALTMLLPLVATLGGRRKGREA